MSPTNQPVTEARNPSSLGLDRKSALEIVQLMNHEDAKIHQAVGRELASIAKAIDEITTRLRRGGRLIYAGAGTSGRLGVLDAAECPPTFNTSPELVVGLIAGGREAITRAVEGAEDRPDQGEQDLDSLGVSNRDAVVGIASSGRTPYVIGALTRARKVGALAVGLVCTPNPALAALCHVLIAPVVGPEVVSGSTRLKAGTATKMVLNMLSTGVMVRLGKTYENLMVDLQATNEKLALRSCHIVAELTGLTERAAAEALARAGGDLKVAVVSVKLGLDPTRAHLILARCGGELRKALEGGQDAPA